MSSWQRRHEPDRDKRYSTPSIGAQKKASGLYGATTDAVARLEQGVTPKGTALTLPPSSCRCAKHPDRCQSSVAQYIAGTVTHSCGPCVLAVTLCLLEIPRLSFDPIARQTRSVGSEAEVGTT